ncbi:MAG: dockerin type I domain-containing protein, partial [candidate division KSB1 bacterium]|nr:dockerin type I domain-containing protein [candidate division KSB1 bacterium]
ENGQDLAGLSVAFIGDVNRDGCDDFVVGAPYTNQGGDDAGKVYLMLGRRDGWSTEMNLADAAASFVDYRAHALTGYSLAGLGDINGDDVPDFAIGAYGASRVFIIYGRRNVGWGSDFDLDDADVMIYGASNEGLGWKVAGPGDLNGDGAPDLIMSAIENSEGGESAGKVYVRLSSGGKHTLQKTSALSGEISFIGERPYDNAGWGLSGAGDVDGDGFNDFLIGAWYNDQNGNDAGKAYLIKGKADGWQSRVPLASVPDFFAGERAINYAGYAVCSAGDFDQDGISDYVISAPYNSEKDTWSGEVYLFVSQMFPCKISGRVTSFRTGYGIAGTVLRDCNDPAAMDSTDSQGNYQLQVLSKKDHTIIVAKAKGEHIGTCVSAYDAALIAQLALGLPLVDSTNVQAADVSRNGRITMYDAAIALRQAVQLPPLPNSHAGEWYFIPDSMRYDSIVADQSGQDYSGYVLGDVDMSWQPPGATLMKMLMNENVDTWRAVRDGDDLRLPVVIPGDEPIVSFDLDLKYPHRFLEFCQIKPAWIAETFELAANSTLTDRLLLGAFAARPISADTLLWIHFKIKAPSLMPANEMLVQRFQVNSRQFHGTRIAIDFTDREAAWASAQFCQNYPNPFNRSTTISFFVPQPEQVKVIIYNERGQEVKRLFDGIAAAGKTQLIWDGTDNDGNDIAAALYFARMITRVSTQQLKLIYLK